jgi:hypothetical protein
MTRTCVSSSVRCGSLKACPAASCVVPALPPCPCLLPQVSPVWEEGLGPLLSSTGCTSATCYILVEADYWVLPTTTAQQGTNSSGCGGPGEQAQAEQEAATDASQSSSSPAQQQQQHQPWWQSLHHESPGVLAYLKEWQGARTDTGTSNQAGGAPSCQQLLGSAPGKQAGGSDSNVTATASPSTATSCAASGPHSIQAEVWLAPFRDMVPPASHARVEVGSWEVVSPREVCFTLTATSVVPLTVLDTPLPGMALHRTPRVKGNAATASLQQSLPQAHQMQC